MKLPWPTCLETAVAALGGKGVEPQDLAHFESYDVPAYGPRYPSRSWNPTEYLDWWPRADLAALVAEIQHEDFWLGA